jgi:hypothetical protein
MKILVSTDKHGGCMLAFTSKENLVIWAKRHDFTVATLSDDPSEYEKMQAVYYDETLYRPLLKDRSDVMYKIHFNWTDLV